MLHFSSTTHMMNQLATLLTLCLLAMFLFVILLFVAVETEEGR